MKPPAQRNTIPLLGAVAQQRPRYAEAPKRFTANPLHIAPRTENTKDAFHRTIQPMTWMQPLPLKDFNDMHYRVRGAPSSLTVNRSAIRPFAGNDAKDPLYDKRHREWHGNIDPRPLWVASTGEFFRK